MPLSRHPTSTNRNAQAPARILACMGSLRMDIWHQTRESVVGRAVTRGPASGDEVARATWYGTRSVPSILRPSAVRHVGTIARTSATR